MAKAKTKDDATLPRIFTVRKARVVMDSDLAKLYGVPTKALNQAVTRNRGRFPEEFSFYLTAEELAAFRSQIVTLKQESRLLGSQSVTLETRGRGEHKKYLPRVFTGFHEGNR